MRPLKDCLSLIPKTQPINGGGDPKDQVELTNQKTKLKEKLDLPQ